MPMTQAVTFDESLIEDLKTMVPGDYYYIMSIFEDRESLLNDLNNSESGNTRKWKYHPLSEIVFCMTPRVYKFIPSIDDWNGDAVQHELLPLLQIRHSPMPIDRNPATEQEIQEAGDIQESMVLESVFMGKFIAAGCEEITELEGNQ